MLLKARNDSIIADSFMTDGCGTTIAAGSMVTDVDNIDEAVKLYLKGKLPDMTERLH
jgi:NifU-like protein involved in Fe-S cluster formation